LNAQDIDRHIAVHGSNIHLGDGLPDHARESIRRVAAKYIGRLSGGSAHFGRDGATYRCCVVITMDGLPAKSAEASDGNIYTAFNSALAKVAKQLRRTKREIREDQPVRLDKLMTILDGLGRPPRP
jgi:ribosomal subunit interface protein